MKSYLNLISCNLEKYNQNNRKYLLLLYRHVYVGYDTDFEALSSQ